MGCVLVHKGPGGERLPRLLRDALKGGISWDSLGNAWALLQSALADEASADAARETIREIVEAMPSSTDALDASELRFAAALMNRLAPINAKASVAATKKVILELRKLQKGKEWKKLVAR